MKKTTMKKVLAVLLSLIIMLPAGALASEEFEIPARLSFDLKAQLPNFSMARSVAAYGNYVYIADRYDGLLIYDATSRENLVRINPADNSDFVGNCEVDMTNNMLLLGSDLYVAYYSPRVEIRKFSLAENPAEPELVANLIPASTMTNNRLMAFYVLADGKSVLSGAAGSGYNTLWRDITVGGEIIGESVELIQGEPRQVYSAAGVNYGITASGQLRTFEGNSVEVIDNGGYHSVYYTDNTLYLLTDSAIRVVDITDFLNGSASLQSIFEAPAKSKTIPHDGKAVLRRPLRWGNFLLYSTSFALDLTHPQAPVAVDIFGDGKGISVSGSVGLLGNYAYFANGGYNQSIYVMELTSSNKADIHFDNITEKNPDEVLNYGFYITNEEYSEQEISVVHAAYNSEILIAADVQTVTVPARTYNYYVECDLTQLDGFSGVPDKYLYKRFVWNDMDTLVPTRPEETFYVDLSTPVSRLTAFNSLANALDIDAKEYKGVFGDLTELTQKKNEVIQMRHQATISASAGIRGIKVYGNYIYMVSGANGLEVWDRTNPTSPAKTSFTDPSGYKGTTSGTATDNIIIHNGYLYVGYDNGNVCKYDLTSPATPSLVADFVGNGNPVYDMAFCGDALIASSTFSYGSTWDKTKTGTVERSGNSPMGTPVNLVHSPWYGYYYYNRSTYFGKRDCEELYLPTYSVGEHDGYTYALLDGELRVFPDTNSFEANFNSAAVVEISSFDESNVTSNPMFYDDHVIFLSSMGAVIFEISDPANPVKSTVRNCVLEGITNADISEDGYIYCVSGSNASDIKVADFEITSTYSDSLEGKLQALYDGGYMTEGTTLKKDITYGEMVTSFQKAYTALGGKTSNYIANGIGYDSSMAGDSVSYSVFSKALRLVKHGNGIPVITRIADEIAPGELFTVYGDKVTKGCAVYIEPASTAGSTPSASARKLDAVQYDETEQFVVAELPESAAGGIYKVWLKNEAGYSAPVLLNQPRPFWMGLSDIYLPGQTAQVAGINFLPSEIGDTSGSLKVKLSNSSNIYTPVITENNPYCVKFTVPDNAAVGKYDITLSVDGVNWTGLESGQALEVVSGSDPYGLGVGWAKNYNYSNEVNVKNRYWGQYLGGYIPAYRGASGDGVTDDTDSINSAINRVHLEGGGVVYLPAGTYSVRYIELQDNVILRGDGQGKTTILYRAPNEGENYFIISHRQYGQKGYQGIYNLDFKVDCGREDFRDFFFWIGDEGIRPWNWNKEFSGFFMKNVDLISPNECGGMGGYAVIDKYFLLDNVNAYSTEGKDKNGVVGGFMPICGDYVTVRNGVSRTIGSTHENLGLYSIYENNTIIREGSFKFDPDLTDDDPSKTGNPHAQGIFNRSHFYIANNIFKNLGGEGQETNDGEIICSENSQGGSVKMSGDVSSATANTVTIAPNMAYKELEIINSDGKTTTTVTGEQIRSHRWGHDEYGWVAPEEVEARWGKHHAVIIAGKGIGQELPVSSFLSENADGTYTYQLEGAWKVIPDETSKVIIMTLTKHGIMYNNTAENAQKGYLIYNGGYDCVIADNKGTNVEGITIRSLNILHDSNRRDNFMPTYFILVKDNEFSGYPQSPDSSHICTIAVIACYEISDNANIDKYTGIQSYGTVIKNNSIDGADHPYQTSPSESGSSNGILIISSNAYSPTLGANVKSVIVENNSVTNSERGLTIGGMTHDSWGREADDGYRTYDGFVVRDNNFSNNDYANILPRENGTINFIYED